MTKTYWQAVDGDGRVYVYDGKKPILNDIGGYVPSNGATGIILFPITLKPLQIATITVNENGTWSWEIEREEGWYMAEHTVGRDVGDAIFVQYRNGEWLHRSTAKANKYELKISTTRIPDECII